MDYYFDQPRTVMLEYGYIRPSRGFMEDAYTTSYNIYIERALDIHPMEALELVDMDIRVSSDMETTSVSAYRDGQTFYAEASTLKNASADVAAMLYQYLVFKYSYKFKEDNNE